MNIKQARCEDEAIHLCGRVQEFGFLIVTDGDQQIIAASDNCEEWLNVKPETLLTENLTYLLDYALSPVSQEVLSAIVQAGNTPSKVRQAVQIALQGHPFYLTVYTLDGHVYLEFEQQVRSSIPSPLGLPTYSEKLENAADVWDALCECIAEVIKFDRVMTYRFRQDKSGQVIAEKVTAGLESYLGLHYPEFDIPKQARALYVKHLARLSPDIHGTTHAVQSKTSDPIDLSFTSIRALSPIHLQYLENAGAMASISFSIIVHGELWGLVTCQHETPKPVDLSQRHLAVFLTQYAVNRYLSLQKETDLHFSRQIKEFELALKEKLIIKNDILPVLSSFAGQLCSFVESDGLAIRHKDGTFTFGVSPDTRSVEKIHNFINRKTRKALFKKEDFSVAYGEELALAHLPFAGLVKMDIDSSKEFSLFWFRKEQVSERLWAGKPEKVMTFDENQQAYIPSPRTSFDAWKQLVKGVAPSWGEAELFFMKRIRQLIRDSLLRKSEEIYSLNQELILLNNALDTYSYTVSHDLKNPLSVVKLSVQMLQAKRDMAPDMLGKLTTNIKDATELMESMLNKIYEFSKVKEFRYQPYLINTDQIIPQIVEHCQTRYSAQNCEIELGQLLPVMGEKTLIYQLFLNIISNAIKYSSKNQAAKVRIDSSPTGRKIRYTVEDNGIGIAKDEVKNIYDIFKRMSNSGEYEGSGVGLAIVKRIVDRLRVQIHVESELDKGTRFHLDFPN